MGSPSAARVWTALGVVYFIWGSTYLAIRYAVGADTGEVGLPPLLMAGARFLLSGAALSAWGARRPAPGGGPDPVGVAQWRATLIIGAALLLGGNGFVTLAEDRGVASGIAAVLIATVPLWIAVLTAITRSETLSRRGLAGLLLGFSGVVILVGRDGGESDLLGSVLVLTASLTWSLGSFYAKSAPLPRRPILATGMQMLCGGALLVVVAVARGELGSVDLGDVGLKAWLGWLYLLTFGSMLAFTAYAWLLQNARLSLVATYAFVNPAVAVALGALPPLREPISTRTLLASAVIVAGVALIVTIRRPGPTDTPPVAVPADPVSRSRGR